MMRYELQLLECRVPGCPEPPTVKVLAHSSWDTSTAGIYCYRHGRVYVARGNGQYRSQPVSKVPDDA